MNRHCAFVVATMALSLHIPPTKVHAQPGILRAAAQYVQRTVLKQHISFDPRISPDWPLRVGPRPGVAQALTIESEGHADLALAELLGDSMITVLSRERAFACSGAWKPECKTNGPESFVRFNRPVVRGDSAFMDSSYWVFNTPTAADTARALANPPPVILSRLTLGGGHLAKMILLRSNNVWRVVQYKIMIQT